MILDMISDFGSYMSEVQQKIDCFYFWNVFVVDEVVFEGYFILEEEECIKRGFDMCDELFFWKV